MDDQKLMERAIAKAREGIRSGQSPFGCAIALDGKLVAVAHNTVLATTDITAHAEVNALREACRTTGQIHLGGSVVATTCEPCPMCLAALHWARVDRVLHGTTIADAASAGFNELRVAAAELLQRGGSSVELESGLLSDECGKLFDEWLSRPDHVSY